MDGAPFPVKTLTYTRDICGTPTDFAFSLYADRVLVVVTQLGAVGTVISTSNEPSLGGDVQGFAANIVLGKRDELLQICARRIVERAAEKGFKRPMVLCLGLREHSVEAMKEVAAAVTNRNIWTA
jgi:proteasome assembly chaperone 3